MLYFRNTSKEIQKLANYAAKSFQLLGGFAPKPLTRGSALDPVEGTAPRPPAYSPMPAISRKTQDVWIKP